VLTFHHGSSCSYIWEMKNKPVGGLSSETYSQPTDMIIIIIKAERHTSGNSMYSKIEVQISTFFGCFIANQITFQSS
jgi:hypothetical protein